MQLKIGTIFKECSGLSDDALGEALVALVREAIHKGRAPTVAAIPRPDQLDILQLHPLAQEGVPLQPLLAGLTRAQIHPPVGDPIALGIMGKVLWGPKGTQRVPMALVFLEWQDCRWWMWRALLDPSDETIQPHTETTTQAIQGDPMPPGLGRWWSLGRRLPNRMTLSRATAPVVH